MLQDQWELWRESVGTDGGDTPINIPGDNVGTDVISPREVASDDESDEPPVLPSNPLPNGEILTALLL